MAVRLQCTGFVLEVVGVDELVEEVYGRALRFRILHPKVSQVGSCVTGQALPCLKPGTAQLTNNVLVGVHLQCCTNETKQNPNIEKKKQKNSILSHLVSHSLRLLPVG